MMGGVNSTNAEGIGITHSGGDIGCWIGVVPATFDPAAGPEPNPDPGRDLNNAGMPAFNVAPSGWQLYSLDCQLFRTATGVPGKG